MESFHKMLRFKLYTIYIIHETIFKNNNMFGNNTPIDIFFLTK